MSDYDVIVIGGGEAGITASPSSRTPRPTTKRSSTAATRRRCASSASCGECGYNDLVRSCLDALKKLSQRNPA